ncbi:hypothetical protein JXA63_01445 [Candidatus Woesebacteria bacterium]|nr:hypothetical protein [Candidatus Woesebacteria bacterium]
MSEINRKTKNEELKIEDGVMAKVKSGEIKMKPKWYFVLGSLLSLMGLVGFSIGAVFLTNLTIFLIRKRGPGYGRLDILLSSFPIWIPVLAISGIALGIWFLKKYDFSYKKNFIFITVIFVLSVIIAGFVVDTAGLNDLWSHKGPLRGLYQRYGDQRGVLQWHREGRGGMNLQ